jgi:hypothetical protein
MSEINYDKVRAMLANGKIFSIVFRKRTTGEFRKMVCRTGVKKYVTGQGLNYKPEDYKLLAVYDLQKKAYRKISFDDVLEINANGMSYFF